MNSAKRASILVVEDNVPLATCLEMLLEANSYEVCRTTNGIGGLESIKLMDFDVILSDLVMPELDGYQLHSAVRQIKPHLCERFIFMSGHPGTLEPSSSASGTDRPIIRKPFSMCDLLSAIEGVVQANRQKRQAFACDARA
jgi:two-component system cell cycle response regulator CtrA